MAEPREDPIPEETLRNQLAVSDPMTSAWVSANAGTGKTHVLTQRVTRLLLNGVRPDRLLCLTFTKAAAAEMANRVFDTLGVWAVCSEDALRQSLFEFTGIRLSGDQIAPARRLFARALETPGGLKIQTVHAFCESLLKVFPIESSVRPGFTVLDDARAHDLMRQAHDEVIVELSAGPAEGRQVLEILSARVTSGDFLPLIDRILGREQRIEADPDGLEEVLRAENDPDRLLANVIAQTPRDSARAWQRQLESGSTKDTKKAEALTTFLESPGPSADFDAYCSVFLTKEGNKAVHLVTKAIQKTNPTLEDEMRQEQQRLHWALGRVRQTRIARNSAALSFFADKVAARYAKKKRVLGALDYGDLIQKTRLLLEQADAAQWVLYKLDGGIEHILIDEAQDTSPDQWAVINSLAAEFFAGRSAYEETRPNRPRTIFAVGDEKQSVYSFRGADPAMFHTTRDHFNNISIETGPRFTVAQLQLSFRSAPEILDIVDETFAQPDVALSLTPEGDRVVHAARRISASGCVELWPVVEPVEKVESVPWDAPLDQESPDAPHARLAARIAQTIAQWLEGGEWLASQNRFVRPSDILILVRRRNVFFEELLRELKRRSIPVAGADRLVLTDHIAVMDLMAVGRFALLPEDDLTLATVLRSPFVDLSEDDLYQIAHDRGSSLWQRLKRLATDEPGSVWAQVYDYLGDVRNLADMLPPFEFFKSLLDTPALCRGSASRQTGWQAIFRRLGTDAEDPVKEFLNLALSYENEYTTGLQAFLHRLARGDLELKREMDQDRDEVRIMTVHGAKGLQSWIVFLPDTCRMPDAGSDAGLLIDENGGTFWAGAAQEDTEHTRTLRQDMKAQRNAEYLRLLYVAMTRAQDRLYISGYGSTQQIPKLCWYKLIERAMRKKAQSVTLPDGSTVLRFQRQASSPPRPAQAAAEAGGDRPEPPALPAFLRRPAQKASGGMGIVSPSRAGEHATSPPVDQVTSPLALSDQHGLQRGRIVHKLLQYLPDCDPADRHARGMRYLEGRSGDDLTRDGGAELLGAVLRLLEDERFVHVFSPQSRAEMSIAGHLQARDGPVLVSGQVDRLVVAGQDVVIVDYKTNRPPPEIVDDVPDLYRRQMALYWAVLKQAFPGKIIRCQLLWTEGPWILELPAEILQTSLEKVLQESPQPRGVTTDET